MSDSISLAMVILRSGKGLNARDIFAAWARLWPDEPAPGNPSKDGSTLSFEVGTAQIVIAAMPAPIPAPDIQAAVVASWMWPGADAAVAGHRAHAIATLIAPELSPVERAVVLTRVIAAVIEAGDVSAVYWGSAGLLCEPASFVASAQEELGQGTYPLTLWVNMILSREGRRTSVSTMGLRALGHKEMEVFETKIDPEQVLEFLGGVVSYVVENGPVLKHGETIGLSAKHKVKIRHVRSNFAPDVEVIQLGL
jgi:hypothetical protein